MFVTWHSCENGTFFVIQAPGKPKGRETQQMVIRRSVVSNYMQVSETIREVCHRAGHIALVLLYMHQERIGSEICALHPYFIIIVENYCLLDHFANSICAKCMPAVWYPVLYSIMMTSSNGNIFRVTGPLRGEFTAQRPMTRCFDVSSDLRLNKRLSKQSWGWWFDTPSGPLWRHRNDRLQQFYTVHNIIRWADNRTPLWDKPISLGTEYSIPLLIVISSASHIYGNCYRQYSRYIKADLWSQI